MYVVSMCDQVLDEPSLKAVSRITVK